MELDNEVKCVVNTLMAFCRYGDSPCLTGVADACVNIDRAGGKSHALFLLSVVYLFTSAHQAETTSKGPHVNTS